MIGVPAQAIEVVVFLRRQDLEPVLLAHHHANVDAVLAVDVGQVLIVDHCRDQ
jgi:hypothetical protein